MVKLAGASQLGHELRSTTRCQVDPWNFFCLYDSLFFHFAIVLACLVLAFLSFEHTILAHNFDFKARHRSQPDISCDAELRWPSCDTLSVLCYFPYASLFCYSMMFLGLCIHFIIVLWSSSLVWDCLDNGKFIVNTCLSKYALWI